MTSETLNQIHSLISQYNETFGGVEEMRYSNQWFVLQVKNHEAGIQTLFHFSRHGQVLEALRVFVETGDVNPLIKAASRVTNRDMNGKNPVEIR